VRLYPRIRHLTEKFKDQAAVVLVALLIGAFAFSSISAYQTDKNTNAIVAGHSAELAKVAALAKQVTVDEKTIARFAKALQSELAGHDQSSLAYLEAICSATPGCSVPMP
jgi:hypothetical protein